MLLFCAVSLWAEPPRRCSSRQWGEALGLLCQAPASWLCLLRAACFRSCHPLIPGLPGSFSVSPESPQCVSLEAFPDTLHASYTQACNPDLGLQTVFSTPADSEGSKSSGPPGLAFTLTFGIHWQNTHTYCVLGASESCCDGACKSCCSVPFSRRPASPPSLASRGDSALALRLLMDSGHGRRS